ncbi:MAG: hypothetical protein ABJM06_00615 [Gilvibacter sp.]
MSWYTKIIGKVVEEVHRSKIDQLNKRIDELVSDHKVMNKTISDNEHKIEKLEEKLYHSTMTSAKMEATLKTVLLLREAEETKLKKNE